MAQTTRDSRPLQWIDLTDFSKGIYQRNSQSAGTAAVPAPFGAAQQTNTYRCYPLPGGGLGPLPRRTETFPATVPEASAPSSGYWIVGFFISGPMSTGIGGQSNYEDQAFLAVAYTPNGSAQQRFRLYRVQLFNSGSPYTVDTVQSFNTGYSGRNFYETCWFAPNRINSSDPTKPGNPVCVVAWSTPGGSNENFIASFPDPANPTVTGMSNLILDGAWGQVYGHQGRICLNQSVAYSMGAVGGSFTDEQLSFTDPPNSNTMGAQQEVFSQEFPTGVGAVGSISAGELFWVKRQGGGVVISGDVANPSITRLPGVTGTGTCTTNRASSTSQGLVYAVKNGGLHLWRGGDTSEKISGQLNDNAFENSNQAPRLSTTNQGFQPIVSTAAWDQWVLVSNNWLWDMATRSWWQIDDDTSTAQIQHWARSFSNQFMFGANPSYGQTGANAYFAWDRSQGATSFSWQSHPIPTTINRLTEVRDMVIVAQASGSGASGSGTVTVTLTGITDAGVDTTQSETFTVTHASQPQRLRPKQGGTFIKGYNVIVRIVSDGGPSDAPVVYSLHLGTAEAQQAVAT